MSRIYDNWEKLVGAVLRGEKDRRIAVFQSFSSSSSADDGHQSLSWATIMKVAICAARALCFLHDFETPVIHRDCQCGNILLDGEFNTKLSNFGFARDGPTGGMTHVSTQVVGTYGIAAPEYVMTDETRMLRIMDSTLEGEHPRNEAYTVAKLTCHCLSTVPQERPRTSERERKRAREHTIFLDVMLRKVEKHTPVVNKLG
ncbi:hypothetical protein C2S52_015163 [Perilla frutescens var. hirtella]|nr:hypothetical protein C2S52_015163 [Perilla frutescens var. hirtella]